MTSSTRIALITVLFNCEKHLPLFFECLQRQTDHDFVVVIVDNASRDRSLALAQDLALRHSVPCEFVPNSENMGIAIGNNQGIERAREMGIEHLVLINNDIACDDNLIASIRNRAILPGLRVWTCLAYYGDTHKRWYGGGALNYWLARGIHWDQAASEIITEPQAVTYAPTCLMYLNANVIDEVGLMDPIYFVYYDDTDFCRRIQETKIPLIYDPTVSFKHYVGGSSGGDLSPFFLRISTRNKFIYISKNYPISIGWAVKLITLASKLGQLLDARRRVPTWQGLKDAWAGRTGPLTGKF